MNDLIYRLSPDVILRSLGESFLLLNQKENTYFSLNATAGQMLKYLCASQSYEDIISKIKEEFDSPEYMIRKDLDQLREELLAQGLILVE